MNAAPTIAPVNTGEVPLELRHPARVRWLNWRYELREGKWSKVPYISGTLRRASVTNTEHLTDFETALAGAQRPGYGVGFVLGEGIAGVDLDDCIDLATNTIKPWAVRIINMLGSYAEVSPSGTGVKVFVRGALPVGSKGVKRPSIEVYDRDRYFTVTGQRLTGVPFTVEEA